MYIHIYIYTQAYISDISMHMFIPHRTCVYIHTYMHACMHACMHAHIEKISTKICVYIIHIDTFLHVSMYVSIYTIINTCLYVFLDAAAIKGACLSKNLNTANGDSKRAWASPSFAPIRWRPLCSGDRSVAAAGVSALLEPDLYSLVYRLTYNLDRGFGSSLEVQK